MALKLTFEIECSYDETFGNDSFRVDYFVNHNYIYFGYTVNKNILYGWYYKTIDGLDHNKIKKYIKIRK